MVPCHQIWTDVTFDEITQHAFFYAHMFCWFYDSGVCVVDWCCNHAVYSMIVLLLSFIASTLGVASLLIAKLFLTFLFVGGWSWRRFFVSTSWIGDSENWTFLSWTHLVEHPYEIHVFVWVQATCLEKWRMLPLDYKPCLHYFWNFG